MRRTSGAISGAIIALALLAATVPAQQSMPGRVPVTVAVTDSTNYGQDIIILRRPGAAEPNLILLSRAAATPEHLAAAAVTLSVIMKRDGDEPAARGLFRVDLSMTAPAPEVHAAKSVLKRLKAEPVDPAVAPGASGGSARTTRIFLPRHPAATGGHSHRA